MTFFVSMPSFMIFSATRRRIGRSCSAMGRENPFTTSYAAEWASFVAAIKGNVAAPSLEAQVVLHQVMEAIFQSAREGGTVEL